MCKPVLLLLLCLALFSGHTDAVTWRVKRAIESELPTWIGYPPKEPECTRPGICVNYEFELPNATLWVWCNGWSTKHRTMLWFNATGANVTTVMMREDEVKRCALRNVSNIKSCRQLEYTMIDTKPTGYIRIFGMSFVDRSCQLVANNDRTKNATVSIKMWQFYDSRRYYGTIFSIILFILITGGVVANVAYTCWYHATKSTTHVGPAKPLMAPIIAPSGIDSASDTTVDAFKGFDVGGKDGAEQAASTSAPGAAAPRRSNSGGFMRRVKAMMGAGSDKGEREH